TGKKSKIALSMPRIRKTDQPPGTIMYTGTQTDMPVQVTYTAYNSAQQTEERYASVQQVVLHRAETELVQWYDIRGLHDTDLIQAVAQRFTVHPLVTESAVDVNKRPEYADFEEGNFWVLKAIELDEAGHIRLQHIALYEGSGFLLSFQEHEDDVFAALRKRIASAAGRIRGRQADYLCYAIIDLVVDRYFLVIDQLQERVEAVEDALETQAETVDRLQLFTLKKQFVKMRRAVAPLRDALSIFVRSDDERIDERTRTYVRDVYDHSLQILEAIDSQREILNSLQDVYLSEISMKMNRIMQVLTIVTAIFVPISFLAGLYGMNFEYMPELQLRYGYPMLLAVMLLIVTGMLWYFKQKKWF
ncbi:MAG: magnesium/cobalt transporter CorA, partial [Bacteroidota bacterium]